MEEIEVTLKQISNGKAPGLDGIPAEVWKLPNMKNILLDFCNEAYNKMEKPEHWSLSAIVPLPKKGDLSNPTNYRGISLIPIATKIFNRLILNRLRPHVDKILRTNQNGFRPNRSTNSHILALRRLIE